MTMPTPPQQRGGQARERTPQDYAIEHAEYMAAGAEHLLNAVNDWGFATDVDHEQIQSATEALTEARSAMRVLIYEFRKRRDRALTSAPPAPSVGGWMPIESAPKDGRKFLAWRRHSTLPLIVFYNADYDQYECSEGHLVFSLTHWQPLPQPPKEKP